MGVSTEWYTWLEQGRPIKTSTQVLESLVRALLLDADERDYLFFLAHQQPPPDIATTVETVNPSLQRYLDHLGDTPAYVTGKYWDIVAWNDAARITFLDYPRLENHRDRNMLWHFFTWPASQEIMLNREELARWLIAAFRRSYGRYLDTQLTKLVQDLMTQSPEFQALWPKHEVMSGSPGLTRVNHPLIGALVFDQRRFQVIDAPDLTVTIFTPMDEANTSTKLSRLIQESTTTCGLQYRTILATHKSVRSWCASRTHQWHQSKCKGGPTAEGSHGLTRLQPLRTNQDPIEQWLSECCTMQSDAWTANASIMASYTKWCEDHGYDTKKAKGLAQALAAHGFEISVLRWVKDVTGKRARVRGVRGFSLREDSLYMGTVCI
jgi:hypothetical protein